MESANVHINLSLNLASYLALTQQKVITRRPETSEALARTREALANLSEAVVGQQLSPAEVQAYRDLLLQTMVLADKLEAYDFESARKKAAEKGAPLPVHIGSMLWQPGVTDAPHRSIEPTGRTQDEVVQQLLALHRVCPDCTADGRVGWQCGNCDPGREVVARSTVTCVRGGQEICTVTDCSELSKRAMAEPRTPVATSNMPPRFPTYGMVLTYATQGAPHP